MKKRYMVICLICINLVLFAICSCKRITDDPFITDSSQAADNLIDETFYGLSSKDAYNKYGIMSFTYDFNLDNLFDGKYLYGTYLLHNEKGELTGATLGRYEYPNEEEIVTVCSDPLCNHLTSSCPLFGCVGVIVACYEGKIYYSTSNGDLCCYDEKTNKKEVIKNGCQSPHFFKYDGYLYLIYSEETSEFEHIKKFLKILPSGELNELGQLDNYFSSFGVIYQDKYYIDYKPEITAENKGKVIILKTDINTGSANNITEIECKCDVYGIDQSVTFMIYGNKLLLKMNYITNEIKAKDRKNITEIWMIDLKSGEKQLICTSDVKTYGTNNAFCLYSDKCIMWCDQRTEEETPLILHVLFPFTGEEKSYDISKMVYDKTGDTISVDAYTNSIVKSAVVFKKYINNKDVTIYQVDLENGNVYKYDVPTA